MLKKIGVRSAQTFALGAVVASGLAMAAPAFADDASTAGPKALGAPAASDNASENAAENASEVGTASVRDCTAEDFVTEETRDAAAGSVYITITFEKLEPSDPYDDEACTMYGALDRMYWGDEEGEMIGGFGRQVGSADSVFGMSPGDQATVTIKRPNPENYDESECEPTEVDGMYLQLFNDDTTTFTNTEGQDSVCATELSVSTVSEITKVEA
ncbi:DUF4232 domain-containing protein [Nocardiopsis sediminis]|uniref:DUF4232 domain-containing protein n=1 Tax=Nocardiopsis sediminis TaxID=1778267 RepID=A0ABV8FVA5_9ACTN